jgi:hypothetical protein
MFDEVSHIAARVAGGAIIAIVPAFLSRGIINRVCEFKPSFLDAYIGFAVGSLAAIAWERVVLTVRDRFIEETPGQAIVIGWWFTWFGGLVLLALCVGYFVRDRKRQPIGIGSGIVVTLLTAILAAPIGLVVWLAMAFFFMPKLPGS